MTEATAQSRLRRMRRHARVEFDRLWKTNAYSAKEKRTRRQSAYRWLSDMTDIPLEKMPFANLDYQQLVMVKGLCMGADVKEVAKYGTAKR